MTRTKQEISAAFAGVKAARGSCLAAPMLGLCVPFPSITGNPPVYRERPFYDARYWELQGAITMKSVDENNAETLERFKARFGVSRQPVMVIFHIDDVTPYLDIWASTEGAEAHVHFSDDDIFRAVDVSLKYPRANIYVGDFAEFRAKVEPLRKNGREVFMVCPA